MCGLDGVFDKLIGVGVEIVFVATRDQLDIARDHAQRLLKVVRRDVGELLQLLIRPPGFGQRFFHRVLAILNLLGHQVECFGQLMELVQSGNFHVAVGLSFAERSGMCLELSED